MEPERRRSFALVALCAGQTMISLDITVVNVALPTIQRQLHFSQSSLAWVVDAYLITFGGFLLLAGRVGDLIGPKKVFVSGVALFTLASTFCGLSDTQAELITGRFLQGAASAIVAATLLGFIVTMFPEPRARARAFGFYGFCGSSGATIGLLVGGALTQGLSWHWIFLINLPIGVGILLLGSIMVEERPGLGVRQGVDLLGAVLVTVASMLLIFAIVQSGDTGWSSTKVIGAFVGTALLVGLFLALETRLHQPILPLRLFRSRNLNTAVVLRVLVPFVSVGDIFVAALYLQHVRGYSPFLTGMAFLPSMLSLAFFSLVVAARLVTKFGAKVPFTAGAIIMFAGAVLLARAPLTGSYFVGIFPGLFLIGVGWGLSVSPSMALGMVNAAPADSGIASGITSVSLQIGSAIAVALEAAVSTVRTKSALRHGMANAPALLSGYHLAFMLAAAVLAAAIVFAVVVWRDKHLGRDHAPSDLALVAIPDADGSS